MVAVLNLLSQMTSLLQMELEAEKRDAAAGYGSDLIRKHEEGSENPLDSLREPSMPCLDLLLSDNILSHILATSRMPVSIIL